MHVLSADPADMLLMVYFSLLSVGAHTMHVFDIWASSSPLGYPCAKCHFCSTPPVAELARGEKMDTQSSSHWPNLFDLPGTETYCFGTNEVKTISHEQETLDMHIHYDKKTPR